MRSNASNIVSKLTLLVLHFPNLRILWSRSPHATVDLFKAIERTSQSQSWRLQLRWGTGGRRRAAGKGNEEGLASSYYNTGSMDVLRKLPGVNEHNFRKVLARVQESGRASQLSLEEMNEMIGKVCGKKLHTFFNSGL